MSEAINSNAKKFTKLILEPRKRFVRIHHTPNAGRDYYTLSFYDENRKRQRQLYRELSVAETEAAKIRRRIDNSNVPGLFPPMISRPLRALSNDSIILLFSQERADSAETIQTHRRTCARVSLRAARGFVFTGEPLNSDDLYPQVARRTSRQNPLNH